MALKRLQIRPGINREGTQHSLGTDGYWDCDLVRFRKGRPESLGGWEYLISDTFKGICRSLFDWIASTTYAYLGVGTTKKFYIESGGAYYDITPIRVTTAAGDVTFSATSGDQTLTVTDTTHGAQLGDYVTFSGAVTLGGNITADVLNHEYEISNIIDGNDYEVEATDASGNAVTANASDTGNGGASVVGEYQIPVGNDVAIVSSGYGTGGYGSGAYGGSSAVPYNSQLRQYSQDVFGDDLIFNPRGLGIYYWDESAGTGTRAVALEDLPGVQDAPEFALQIMVSEQDRHVIAFGATPLGSSTINPMLVRWSDQESAIDWLPTATNTSGGVVLTGGGKIIAAVQTRQEIIIFTDRSIHSMRYSGTPFVFAFTLIAQDINLIGPKAAIAVGDNVFFMADKGFYVYEGAIREIPCSVFDYVYSGIDRQQQFKSHAGKNPDNSEIFWFYPEGSTDTEINRYVIYNYAENTWAIGGHGDAPSSLARAAWIEASTRQYPIASSVDTVNIDSQYLYSHEKGLNNVDTKMTPYVTSGLVDISEGNHQVFMRRFFPDFRTKGTRDFRATVQIYGTDFPMNAATLKDQSSVDETQGALTQNHVRVRARYVYFNFLTSRTGIGWVLGDTVVDIRPDGGR